MVLGTVVITENPTPLAAAARFSEVRLVQRGWVIHQVSKYGFAPVCTQDSDSHRDCKDSEAKLVRPFEAQQLGYVLLIIECYHMNEPLEDFNLNEKSIDSCGDAVQQQSPRPHPHLVAKL